MTDEPTSPPLIVIDLETSGLDPRRCAILEIGAVAVDWEDFSPLAEFHREVRYDPPLRWEAGAEKVHGLTMAQAGAPDRYSAAVALHELLEWLEDLGRGARLTLAGMNPRFDRDFFAEAVCRALEEGYDGFARRFSGLVSHRTIDLHTLAAAEAWRYGLGCSALHTDAIYGMLGMDPEPRPHRALTGARLEAEAIRLLMTGDAPDFSMDPDGGVPIFEILNP